MAQRITQIYNQFRGVDLRGGECATFRSPDARNVWRDYKETASIRTRPTLEQRETQSRGAVYGISFYKDFEMRHIGSNLEFYRDLGPNAASAGVLDNMLLQEPSQMFVYNGVWYIKQRGIYSQFDGEEYKGVEGYVPTTSIGRKPEGGGTVFEDVNMLTRERKNTFAGDGESTVYHLDAENILSVTGVRVSGSLIGETYSYTVDKAKGTVTLDKAPPAPATGGQDNVVIQFSAGADQRGKILGCELVQIFDNRVFFSGNPEYPNMIWHSSLDDPTYVSDLDYYQEGRDEAPVRGMVAGNNALWVFRGPSDENTTVFYHQPVLDATYGKTYPSVHSSISTGCVGKAVNFNDDIVFFSDRGMEGISGNVTTEQILGHRSSLVDKQLLAEPGYRDMILAEWEGYLLVFVGTKVYLADSRATFANGNQMEYEWFYWDLGVQVTCAAVHEGVLYIGTKEGELGGGVYTLTGTESVHSYWTTATEKFQNPNRLKTTNKRGCVAEAAGDVAVYAKTEDTDFERIGEHKGVTDYFVSRIKRKKFKDIQLKFQSDTRFSLESVTLEAFIGGHIKR